MNGILARYEALPANLRGAVWITLSSLTFAMASVLVKYLGGDYPSPLQAFYRSLVGVVVMAPIILRNPKRALSTTRPLTMTVRGVGITLALMMSFYSYYAMPLAEANALSFTRTLWLVPIAALLLRERMGPRRIAAAIVGFAGVLIMVQPTGAPMGLPAIAGLAAALLLAFTVAGMKSLTRDHSTLAVLSWSAVIAFLTTLPFAFFWWRWPTPLDFALLCAMGLLGLLTQACYVKGMTLGDAGAMATIDYIRLPFTIFFGFTLFHDVPNAVTMLGAAIVIASTLYITWRESQLGRQPPRIKAE